MQQRFSQDLQQCFLPSCIEAPATCLAPLVPSLTIPSLLQGDVKKVTDDVAALKPSIFAAVPRVLDRMKSGIEAKIKKQPGWRQAIFRTAYNIKRFMRRLGRFDLVRRRLVSVLCFVLCLSCVCLVFVLCLFCLRLVFCDCLVLARGCFACRCVALCRLQSHALHIVTHCRSWLTSDLA